ncbi:hypothetical protein AB0L00_39645 [Actinoallomurus sp. NPDC052308]|uniref:hypothetical protein n=1 Tax=Actinoallomurus sp. NPDC052308 TaxID=3155530 RepID=UPI003425E7A8
MTDPIKSKYDEDPYDPDAPSQDSDYKPGTGDQASPDLKVAWAAHPSFNVNPKDIDEDSGGSPGGDASGGDAGDFKVGYEALGTQVNEMLDRARKLVDQYEKLRSKVQSTEGSIFGQNSTVKHDGMNFNYSDGTWGGTGEDWTSPSDFAEPAKQYADQMNPIQHATLHQVGGSLELVGEYIALVNHSGQVYAAADRHSAFPPPPPNKVTG